MVKTLNSLNTENNYINKRKYNKRKSNKRKSNKRKTNKGKTNKGNKLLKTPFLNNIYKAKGRVVVIGDLHGDWDATIGTLRNAGVLRENKHGKFVWTGGNTFVIQVGDQVDRKSRDISDNTDEASELKIIKLFDYLHNLAQKKGGAVLSLLGNHELMNVDGNFNYASEMGIRFFGGPDGRYDAFKPGGWLSKYLAENRSSFFIVNNWLFVHGGITKDFVDNYSLNELNYYVREYLLGNIDYQKDQKLDYFLHHPNSVFWARNLGNDSVNCEEVNYICKKLKLKGIVVGHTVQDKINCVCNGKVWRIDVGLSKSFGNRGFYEFKEFKKL